MVSIEAILEKCLQNLLYISCKIIALKINLYICSILSQVYLFINVYLKFILWELKAKVTLFKIIIIKTTFKEINMNGTIGKNAYFLRK